MNPCMSRIVALLALFVLLAACGSSGRTTSDGVSPDQIDVTKLPYPVETLSARDIVLRHKSNWLKKRRRSSISNPTSIKVYLGNASSSYGGLRSLENIRGMNIATIEYFNPREAQLKFGLGNNSGAILVRTRGFAE